MANDTNQEKSETLCQGRHNYDASPKVRERVRDTKHWTRETLFLGRLNYVSPKVGGMVSKQGTRETLFPGRHNYDILIIILYNTDIINSIVKLIVHSPVGKLV